jgi:hypothetical protein
MAGPAVNATEHALSYFGPSLLTQKYWDRSVQNKDGKTVGGWLDRLQSAPGPGRTSSTDPHIAGRALDIILFRDVPIEKGYADRIVQIFLNMRASMNFIAVIYNRWEWNGAGDRFPRPPRDPKIDFEPHDTHIHIEWSAVGLAKNSFASDLEDALTNEFMSTTIATGDWATA